jgi:hypothetical protein
MDEFTIVRDAARIVMADRWGKDGVTCPCCGQLCKVYRRSITRSMAKVMVAMYDANRAEPTGWRNIPELLRLTPYLRGPASQGGDWGKLVYWGLVERWEEDRGDGSRRCGQARLTDLGLRFLRRQITVRRYANVYDGECIGLTGPDVGIEDSLPRDFNFQEIL